MILTATINEVKRRILFDNPQAVVAVKGDYEVNGIAFAFPAIYEDDFDLSTAVKTVYYKATDGIIYNHVVTDTDTDTGYPLWVFKDEINKGAFGDVEFALVCDKVEGGNIVKRWVSMITAFRVQRSIEIDESAQEDNEQTYSERLAYLMTQMANMQATVSGLASGAPTPESLVANMQAGRIYVYTGTETGYNAGHLYYYVNGTLTDGGQYGGTTVDATLTVSGAAADAKVTGDKIAEIKEDLDAYSNKAIKALSFSDGTPSGNYSIVFPTFVQGGISISSGTTIKYTESARDIRTETPISGGYLIHNLDTDNNNIRVYIFVNGKYSNYMRDVQWNNIMPGEWIYLPIISGYTYQICFHTLGSSITLENAPIEMLRIAKSENPLNDVVPGYAWNATEGTAANSKRAYMIFPGVKKGDVIKFNGELYSVNYYVLGGNLTDLFYTPNGWDSTGEIKVNAPDDKSYQLFVQFKWSDNERITADRAAYISNFTQIITDLKTVDLFIFMGQSNMAGRGITNSNWTEKASKINYGAGYEFKAISDPTKLYPALEPFGVDENQTGGIDDTTPDNEDLTTGKSKKTGSCVVALMNSYFGVTGIPIVGVSASEGGTTIAQWQPDTDRLDDAINRLNTAVTWLEANGYYIRHKYMMWCQGENDSSTPSADYKASFSAMLGAMKTAGIEKCFLARIGEYNSGSSTAYSAMIQCQTEIGQEMADVIMCTTDLASFRDRGLMKDKYHFYQAAYNEMGRYSGANIAVYVKTGKEPTMYDPKYNNLYYSHKN